MISRLKGRSSLEKKKVAVYRHRAHALWRCTIHVAPVGTCLALLVLNIGGFYIGAELSGATGEDTQKLAALQVASKLLEMLILSSLASIVLTFVQRGLVLEGIPLGSLLAAKEISTISYLWSPRFWGALPLKNDGAKGQKRWSLVLLIAVSAILGVFVGPLSATLIIPRVGNWPAGGTAFWVNGTRESLFPKRIEASDSLLHCDIDTGDPSCPHGGWDILNQDYYSFWPQLQPMGSMPTVVYMPSLFSQRYLSVSSASNISENGLLSSIWTANSTASVPFSIVSDALAELQRLWSYAAANHPHKRFWAHKEAVFTARAPKPLVQTFCASFSNGWMNQSAIEVSFPVCHDSPDAMENFRLPSDFLANDRSLSHPPSTLWVDDLELKGRTKSTLNAIISIPRAANGQSMLFTCSIDSALPEVEITMGAVKIVSSKATESFSPRVDLSSTWAKYLNPQLPSQNSTLFSKIASTAGLWNTTTPSHDYNYQYIIESILATLIANGIGRSTYNSRMVGHLRGFNPADPWGVRRSDPAEWLAYMLPSKNVGFNDDPKHSAFDALSLYEATQSTVFIMRAAATGYAFSAQGNAAKAAIAVLTVYIMLAFCHTCYLLITGWASTMGDSSLEIAMLSARSRPTRRLLNIGVGTETVDVYRERVQIRARHDDQLELVFQDTDDGASPI